MRSPISPRCRQAGVRAGLSRAKSREARRAEAGFSLVELLIAIVVLLAGIVAVAQLVPAAMNSNFKNRNDSTALIVAQRELEQMVQQPLDARISGACTGTAPTTDYYFCDREDQLVSIGWIDITLGANFVSERGCALDSNQLIDFTTDCDAGYSVTKTWTWNPVENISQTVEIRWRTITLHNGGIPQRRIIIIAARAGQAGQTFRTANLQTIVGRK